jgi:hypothetical protein
MKALFSVPRVRGSSVKQLGFRNGECDAFKKLFGRLDHLAAGAAPQITGLQDATCVFT